MNITQFIAIPKGSKGHGRAETVPVTVRLPKTLVESIDNHAKRESEKQGSRVTRSAIIWAIVSCYYQNLSLVDGRYARVKHSLLSGDECDTCNAPLDLNEKVFCTSCFQSLTK